MKEKQLNERLKRDARINGLCDQWYNSWGTNNNMQQLIDKYLRGLDFVCKRDFPSLSFIKENFSTEILHSNNIFIDEDIQLKNPKNICVLNGQCTGSILFDGYSICDVYVRHNCDITIDCSKFSKVFINVYGKSKVRVCQKDIASVYIYIHGECSTIETDGNVLIRKSQM